eukprot:scaffold13874_cov128-Isochrysis_galbana.AAC.1
MGEPTLRGGGCCGVARASTVVGSRGSGEAGAGARSTAEALRALPAAARDAARAAGAASARRAGALMTDASLLALAALELGLPPVELGLAAAARRRLEPVSEELVPDVSPDASRAVPWDEAAEALRECPAPGSALPPSPPVRLSRSSSRTPAVGGRDLCLRGLDRRPSPRYRFTVLLEAFREVAPPLPARGAPAAAAAAAATA